jgi:membrane-associated PAP2 superfamily phosphatase
MNPPTLRWQIGATSFGLLLTLLLFELTPADIWLQSLLFDTIHQQWLWSGEEPIARLILYTGIKRVLIVFGLAMIALLIASFKVDTLLPYRQGLRIVVLALILVPVCTGGLKAVSNVACPRALTEFGGSMPYAGIFGTPTTAAGKAFPQQRCFPAGHASGGFALLALPFLFTRRRQLALAAGLGVGWTMGGYKMVIGDHFLSHTLVTMLLAWLIICLIALADQRFFGRGPALHSVGH